MTTFRLPDVGEGLQEAEIILWHVGPGDRVVADQPLVTIQTDKAVVEIPSPRTGHINRLHAGPGDIVQVGAGLVDFTDTGAPDAGAIVGDLGPVVSGSGESTAGSDPAAGVGAGVARAVPVDAGRVVATPAVRVHARRLGVDLAGVTPTGANGTVTMIDVDRAASAAKPAAELVPLRGVRRAMAANMARAHAVVVPATVTDLADIGAWKPDDDPTLRLVRAVGVACVAEPALNMWFHGREEGRSVNTTVDLGMAMDTAEGLFVPVLRDVVNRSAPDLRRELEAVKAAVLARSVPPDRLRGQTITLSNFGMHGGRHAALVVVPPQVAIIGAGRIESAIVARDDRPVVTTLLPVSLTFDHRVVMGGEAARFLTALVEDLRLPI